MYGADSIEATSFKISKCWGTRTIEMLAKLSPCLAIILLIEAWILILVAMLALHLMDLFCTSFVIVLWLETFG